MTATLEPTTTAPEITVTKLGEHIGAIVHGVRVDGDIDDATAETILDLLAEHEVIFFRGQDHLDDAGQHAFAARLGVPTTPHPTVRSDSDLLPIEGAANSWHTDVSFVDRVPKASILRPVELPPHGGNTTWASTTRAYDRLPAPLKALAENLRAIHTPTITTTPATTPPTSAPSTTRSSSATSSRPSTPWCACTRRRAAGRSCWATS